MKECTRINETIINTNLAVIGRLLDDIKQRNEFFYEFTRVINYSEFQNNITQNVCRMKDMTQNILTGQMSTRNKDIERKLITTWTRKLFYGKEDKESNNDQ